MNILSRLSHAEHALAANLRRIRDSRRVARYLKSDRVPWTVGYGEHKHAFIAGVLADEALMRTFRHGGRLPSGFGFRLDERAVEWPWLLSRLAGHRRLLDAGSALNHEFLLQTPVMRSMRATIMTLAPENVAYWQLGVSYVFGDLRNIGFRDGWFDAISCISTIEHVGMDNALYATESDGAARGQSTDFIVAVREMSRVLAPGGSLYISFPFGKRESHGWLQQFDAGLTDQLIAAFGPADVEETIYRYSPDGWQVSDRASCAECEYFNVHALGAGANLATTHAPDYAAAARAVACLQLTKGATS